MNRRTNVTKPQAKAQPAPEANRASRAPGPASEAISQAEIERLVERIVERQLNRLLRQTVASQIDAEPGRPASVTGASKAGEGAYSNGSAGAKAARESVQNDVAIYAGKAVEGAYSDGAIYATMAGEGAQSDSLTCAAKTGEDTYNDGAIYAAMAREGAQNDAATGAEDAGEADGFADTARAREDALNRREAELDRRELRAWVADEMLLRELPIELAEVVDLSDVQRCTDAVDALEKAFRQAVQRGVDERINRGSRTLPRSTGDVPAGMSQRMRAAAGLM